MTARVVVRVEEHPMAGKVPDKRRYIAICKTGECAWKSKYQVVKVAAEDEARYHRAHHRSGAL